MLASTIREIIAPVLRLCPHECEIVSITRVEISSDNSYVTAYISALTNPERALEFLEKERGSVQKSLGTLHRKKIPQVRFRIDQTVVEGSRIDELLRRASQEPGNPLAGDLQ